MPAITRRMAMLSLLAAGLGGAAASDLIAALRGGGLVLVVRHAHSPLQPPVEPEAANARGERELDAAGRAQAIALGRGLRAAGVSLDAVLSSPAYRAVQTVELGGLGPPRTRPELGDGGQSMAASASGAAGAAWLRARVAVAPPRGRDVLLVTHLPNLLQAFGSAMRDVQDGEAVVFRPDGHGGAAIIGRIRAEDWPGA